MQTVHKEDKLAEMKTYYYRHRPHYQPPGATMFITFRLKGSLPEFKIKEIRFKYDQIKQLLWNFYENPHWSELIQNYYAEQKKLIELYDRYLHEAKSGPHYLKNNDVAEIVCQTMKYWHGKKYDLIAYCIMSNHVHVVLKPLEINKDEYHSISRIMHSIKSYTANKANRLLNRVGQQFWEHENFDHFSRSDDETVRIVNYVLHNPVKANLVIAQKEYPWNYYKFW